MGVGAILGVFWTPYFGWGSILDPILGSDLGPVFEPSWPLIILESVGLGPEGLREGPKKGSF